MTPEEPGPWTYVPASDPAIEGTVKSHTSRGVAALQEELSLGNR